MKSAESRRWVGFDLGGTKMLSCVFDSDFKVLGTERKRSKAYEGLEYGIDRVIRTIKRAMEESGTPKKQLGAIGVGIPGMVDLERGIVLDAPNLGWKNVNIATRLRQVFHCPVVLANDVDCGVYAEYRFGVGKRAHCLLGVFPGTGIGGGCVVDGKILQGRRRSCMEIGHMQVMPDGPLCGCGQRGCLEALASRLAISSAASLAAVRGQAPRLLELAGTDITDMRSNTLASAIRAGDKVVERIVREAAQWLGVGVANAVNLLAPDVVVLGGGLPQALPRMYVNEVERSARRHAMEAYRDTFRVVPAGLGDDAIAIGAAAWAMETAARED